MSDEDSDHSDYAMPARGVIPSGQKNRGWQGEQMELAHARESESKKGSAAAVDLSQFRNEEVGKGYQAKFVVRQRNAQDEESTPSVKDMTKKTTEEKKSRKSKRKSRDGDDDEDRKKESDNPKNRLDKYLKSEGLRRFRKELEKF
eukprot:scaffold2486_cov160-Amphora_coffeaeformis.AAC.1